MNETHYNSCTTQDVYQLIKVCANESQHLGLKIKQTKPKSKYKIFVALQYQVRSESVGLFGRYYVQANKHCINRDLRSFIQCVPESDLTEW